MARFSKALFVLVLLSSNVQAQKLVQINWKDPLFKYINGKEIQVLNFEGAFYHNFPQGIPTVQLERNFENLRLTHQSFVPLTDFELALIDSNIITNQAEFVQHKGFLYKRPTTINYLVPFRKNKSTGKFEKLISFGYNSDLASQARREKAVSYSSIGQSTNSVLSTGEWYKLGINSSVSASGDGVYKLDFNYLSKIGFPVGSVDPRKIKIYGNALGMLPEANSVDRPDDLLENNILVVGEEDGKFDKEDYILFYAKGPHDIIYNQNTDEYRFEKNIYDETAYYFLTYSDNPSKRINQRSALPSITTKTTTAKGFAFFEVDEFNLLQSGRKWYSNEVERPLNFNLNLPGLFANATSSVQYSLMAQGKVLTNFNLNVSGQVIESGNIQTYDQSSYGIKGRTLQESRNIDLNTSNVNVSVIYNNRGDNTAKGYLDWFAINYPKTIGKSGNFDQFKIKPSAESMVQTMYAESSKIGVQVWNITQPHQAFGLTLLDAENGFDFTDSITQTQEYILFRGANFSNPSFVGKIGNQNLHGISSNLPKLIIITPEVFKPAADKLAEYRAKKSNIKVEVVTLSQIYNEFSSGKQDLAAIRDFLRMLYLRSSGNDTIRNVLLMGAASYDYKNRIENNTNMVPIFESRESLHNVDSYCSDDFIALLDPNEGDWEQTSGYFTLDVGVGRLPAQSLEDAMTMVNKIIDYECNPLAFGKWRNIANFSADDTSPSEPINSHALNSEVASDELERQNKILNVRKLYVDSYAQIPSPGGEISPAINNAMLNNINTGNLIVNYSGHGSEFQLAQEKIIDINDLNALKNKYRLPFFIAATCEFGRYDDPSKYSGAKSLMLNPNGGGIGLLCSTRPVYASSNTNMNVAFYRSLLGSELKPNQITLGEAMMRAKNNRIAQSGINNRNYALLADPSLVLGFAKNEIRITAVNERPYDPNKPDTLKALGSFKIKGEITNNGEKIKDFKGKISLSLFDKETMVSSIGTPPNIVMNYQLRNSLVYDGSVSVDSGTFEFNFVVPKDINYSLGKAKFSFYAHTENENPIDASYADYNIKIGGSASGVLADNTPPQIRLFMDDTTFVNGGLTNTNTLLLAKLYDDNGFNISNSSIGHEITAELNNSKEMIVLNEYFSNVNNSFKFGVVSYPLNKLVAGKYTIRLKAWDTHNNSASSSLEFVVGQSEKLILEQVMNFPNPVFDNTNFKFDHNRTGEDLEVVIEITNQQGRIVKTIDKLIPSAPTTVSDIKWYADDDETNPLSAGCYIYHIKVRSKKDNARAFKIQRLVLLK